MYRNRTVPDNVGKSDRLTRSAAWLGAAAAGPAAPAVTMVTAPISAASDHYPLTRAMRVLGICPPAFLLRSGPLGAG